MIGCRLFNAAAARRGNNAGFFRNFHFPTDFVGNIDDLSISFQQHRMAKTKSDITDEATVAFGLCKGSDVVS